MLTHAEVPANDGGLSLGQAAIGAARLLEARDSRKRRDGIMCLGIPGCIVGIDDADNMLATVDVCGVRRQINISCIVDDDHPVETCVGDWVLVHVGFAMSRIDADGGGRNAQDSQRARRERRPSSKAYARANDETSAAEEEPAMSNASELKASLSVPARQATGPGGARCGACCIRSRKRRAIRARPMRAFSATRRAILVAAAKALADVYRRGGRMFSMGNGGSSCDASHVAVEFVHPITAGRPALAAINLVADLAMISAVGNDVGFEHVFVRQVIAQGKAGDGLIGISTSGNSSNLIAAFAKAKEMGLVTIGLAGGDGGKMKSSGVCDHCLVVPTTSIHRIQECHVTAYHILWDLVHTMLADDRGSATTKEAAA